MNEFAKRIQDAITTTKQVVPGYYEKTVEQRNPKTGCGSIVNRYKGHPVSGAVGHLCFYDAQDGWKPYPECPNLIPGCTAFINYDVGGELGIVDLGLVADDTPVTLDDRKNTGTVSATIHGARGKVVDFIVAILGDEQGKEVLFTFHPGDPVAPSTVKAEPGLHGKVVTVKEAIQMGLKTAKIV